MRPRPPACAAAVLAICKPCRAARGGGRGAALTSYSMVSLPLPPSMAVSTCLFATPPGPCTSMQGSCEPGPGIGGWDCATVAAAGCSAGNPAGR